MLRVVRLIYVRRIIIYITINQKILFATYLVNIEKQQYACKDAKDEQRTNSLRPTHRVCCTMYNKAICCSDDEWKINSFEILFSAQQSHFIIRFFNCCYFYMMKTFVYLYNKIMCIFFFKFISLIMILLLRPTRACDVIFYIYAGGELTLWLGVLL